MWFWAGAPAGNASHADRAMILIVRISSRSISAAPVPDGSTTLRKGDQIIHGSFFGQSSFANFVVANERNVVKVRKDVPLEILGPWAAASGPAPARS